MIKNQWLIKLLKKELSLISNVAFGFILMGLEKIMEMEFRCPCKFPLNVVLSLGFFIIPAGMASTMMLIIEKRRCDAWFRIIVSSSVPAFMWLVLMFFDGQYLACAMSTWEGRFVVDDKEAKINWCKPNVTSDKAAATQNFYSLSQGIGECLLLVMWFGLMGYVIQERCCGSRGIQAEGDPPGEGDRPPGGDRPPEGVEMENLLPSTTEPV